MQENKKKMGEMVNVGSWVLKTNAGMMALSQKEEGKFPILFYA